MTEPEKVMMARYRCVHCRRSWASRAIARRHAERCWYDPANRACKTCVHFTRDYRGEEGCAAGVALPLIERRGEPITTLAVHCDSHRVDATWVNPDVIDVLHEVEPAS